MMKKDFPHFLDTILQDKELSSLRGAIHAMKDKYQMATNCQNDQNSNYKQGNASFGPVQQPVRWKSSDDVLGDKSGPSHWKTFDPARRSSEHSLESGRNPHYMSDSEVGGDTGPKQTNGQGSWFGRSKKNNVIQKSNNVSRH